MEFHHQATALWRAGLCQENTITRAEASAWQCAGQAHA
jgi:hypothetical protein